MARPRSAATEAGPYWPRRCALPQYDDMAAVVVIGNPKAGRGAVGRGWERLLTRVRDAGLDAEGHLTEASGHAVELARSARGAGAELVVAAGGDGTVHEVVNGLLADGPGDDVPVLGVVPAGSGCDYAKTFDIPPDVEGAVGRLASDAAVRMVDVGEVSFGGQRRYFANIAEVGVGAEVTDRAARLPRWLGASVYFFGFWATLPRFEQRAAHISMDGAAYDGPLTNLVVAVGRVFGGGMRITPNADPSDGLFDVQIHLGSKLDFLRAIPKVYKGTHLPHPRIREERAAVVEVACEPAGLIEADGEVLGHTPATFRTIPAALRLKGGLGE